MQQTTVQVPRDASQLSALRARRDELASQLDGLSDRRQKLVNERFNATVNQHPGVVGQLDVQIQETSARLKRIETEKLAMDDAISAALKQGISDQGEHLIAPAAPPEPTQFMTLPGFGVFDTSAMQHKYERMMMAEALGFILIGFALWRWGARRGRGKPALSQGDAQLRQAVDSIAIEVERISENQRYVTKLLSEQNQAAGVPRSQSEGERLSRDAR